jgi:hypothetical protein
MRAGPPRRSRAGRLAPWLGALVGVAVVAAVVVGPVTAARAQAADAPLERAMQEGEQPEDQPGRFPTSHYVTTFEISPLLSVDCDVDLRNPQATSLAGSRLR